MKLKLEKPWSEVAARLMEHNKDLTKEDLAYQQGREEELLDRLAKKMSRSQQEVREWIESISFNE